MIYAINKKESDTRFLFIIRLVRVTFFIWLFLKVYKKCSIIVTLKCFENIDEQHQQIEVIIWDIPLLS